MYVIVKYAGGSKHCQSHPHQLDEPLFRRSVINVLIKSQFQKRCAVWWPCSYFPGLWATCERERFTLVHDGQAQKHTTYSDPSVGRHHPARLCWCCRGSFIHSLKILYCAGICIFTVLCKMLLPAIPFTFRPWTHLWQESQATVFSCMLYELGLGETFFTTDLFGWILWASMVSHLQVSPGFGFSAGVWPGHSWTKLSPGH